MTGANRPCAVRNEGDSMQAWQIVTLAAKAASMVMQVLENGTDLNGGARSVTETVKCAGCEEEAWVIRWGAIRVGQDLSGWYAQATADGAPILLCRACWYKSIGMDDPTVARQD